MTTCGGESKRSNSKILPGENPLEWPAPVSDSSMYYDAALKEVCSSAVNQERGIRAQIRRPKDWKLGTTMIKILTAFLCIFSSVAFASDSGHFSYRMLEDQKLALEIGEILYNQPGDGCWSCHGGNGAGVRSPTSKAVEEMRTDLRNRETWSSFKIIDAYASENPNQLTQKAIATSLIRLGAKDWNRKIPPIVAQKTKQNNIYFDQRMIGIHSKYLKKNTKRITRLLKRRKVKYKRKHIMDLMATSVYLFIEEKFRPTSN